VRIRPQILAGIIAGTVVACLALYIGYWMGAVEIVTAVVGSIFGFLSGVSFKILESE
tara:strand:- start:169 stop:339 length:171 start_codon:yes stop_codon:yes gene_type:complete